MKKYFTIAAMLVAVVALIALTGCSATTPPASSSSAAPSSSTAPSDSTAPSGSGSTAPAGAQAVDISNFAFAPADLTVKVGDTVTWTNNDTVAHTVTAADFDSGSIAPGATFSHAFDKAGSFDYKCTFHPQMTAKVTVQ